jgi:hypothetical protein
LAADLWPCLLNAFVLGKCILAPSFLCKRRCEASLKSNQKRRTLLTALFTKREFSAECRPPVPARNAIFMTSGFPEPARLKFVTAFPTAVAQKMQA